MKSGNIDIDVVAAPAFRKDSRLLGSLKTKVELITSYFCEMIRLSLRS